MRAAAPILLAGTRVRVRIPRANQLVAVRGVPSVVHACGLGVVAIPAALDPDGREFLDVSLRGMLDGLRQRGLRCAQSHDLTEWRCQDATQTNFIRRIDVPEGAALVSVEGPRVDGRALREISRSATYDPAAPFDPLAQMGISLAPPEGMTMAATSTAGTVEYRAPGDPDSPDAVFVEWEYVLYAVHPQHGDNSAWTNTELNEAMGRLAATLYLSSLDIRAAAIREGLADGSVLAVTIPGQAGTMPVLVYVRAVRDTLGVFFAIARIPTALVPLWLPRIEIHARTLQLDRTRGPSRTSSEALPDVPTDTQLREVRERLAMEMRSCGAVRTTAEPATMRIVVRGATGRAETAELIHGRVPDTVSPSCIVRRVLGSQFPRFRRSTFAVELQF